MISSRRFVAISIALATPVAFTACSKQDASNSFAASTTTSTIVPAQPTPSSLPMTVPPIDPSAIGLSAEASIVCEDLKASNPYSELATYFSLDQSGDGTIKMYVGPSLVKLSENAPQNLKDAVGRASGGTWISLSGSTPDFVATYKRDDGTQKSLRVSVADQLSVSHIDNSPGRLSSTVSAYAIENGAGIRAGVAYEAGHSPNTLLAVRLPNGEQLSLKVPVGIDEDIPSFENIGGLKIESNPIADIGNTSIAVGEGRDDCVGIATVRKLGESPSKNPIPPAINRQEGTYISSTNADTNVVMR